MKNQSPIFFRYFLSEWMVFFVASLFLASLFSYHLYSAHQSTMAQEKARLIHSATASEYIIGKQLENISITLDKIRTTLSPDWEKLDNSKQLLNERLELLGSAMPSVQAVTLLNKDGKVLASSKQVLIGQSFAHRDYFRVAQAAPADKTLYVSPPFEGIYGDWLIAFSKIVLDMDGEFAGIVFILLNAQEYKQSLNALRPPSEAWASLVHGDGILFAWEPETIGVTGQNLAKLGSLFTQYIESGNPAAFFSDKVTVTNEESLIAVRTINPAKLHMNKPLILGVARKTENLYQALRRDIFYIAAIFMFLSIAAGIALYLSQRTRQRTLRIAENAEAKVQNLSQQLTHFFELTPSFMAIADKEGYCQRLTP